MVEAAASISAQAASMISGADHDTVAGVAAGIADRERSRASARAAFLTARGLGSNLAPSGRLGFEAGASDAKMIYAAVCCAVVAVLIGQ